MKNIKKEDLNIPVQSREKEVMCRVIEVSDGSTRTKELIKPVPAKDGYLDWENSEYCLIAVFKRHGKNGN